MFSMMDATFWSCMLQTVFTVRKLSNCKCDDCQIFINWHKVVRDSRDSSTRGFDTQHKCLGLRIKFLMCKDVCAEFTVC